MSRLGTVSYNIHCNFTNYGSALQTWALHQAIKRLRNDIEPVLVDYCPDCLMEKDLLDPLRNMWDMDEESRRECELSLPAIRINAKKFDDFYMNCFTRTKKAYTSNTFEEIQQDESLDGFICGSDTIFCLDEFDGFDDGYYANFDCMRGRSVAYAASFGDQVFSDEQCRILEQRISNFRAIGLRESTMLPYCSSCASIPVQQVLDPTLLLDAKDYESITADPILEDDYLLLYSRRYNKGMERFADYLAKRNGWKVVEISLRASNESKHRMFYEAGVEEFLSLVKNAEYVITNSFHGAIFSAQFNTPFFIFSREQCGTKINELLKTLCLEDRLLSTFSNRVDYEMSIDLSETIARQREQSYGFLQKGLEMLVRGRTND